MAYDFVMETTASTLRALETHESAWGKKASDDIRVSRTELSQEFVDLRTKYGTIDEAIITFQKYLEMTKNPPLQIESNQGSN
jgi:hypothetical protein